MNRDVYHYLAEWKKSAGRKPLILRGARQVGKSWLVKECAKTFNSFVEINFDKTPEISALFTSTREPKKLIELISNYTGIRIIPGETLLFFDEIQNCPDAIASLRYFFEDMPGLHVISAGSLIEFELQKISIPVGRLQFLQVYPMSFGEFLDACGREDLRQMLLAHDRSGLEEPVNRLLKEFIRAYTITGGMPEVVKCHVATADFLECQNIQSDIIQTCRRDFNKYAKRHQVKYLEKIFSSLALHVGSKLTYAKIDSSVKSTILSEALDLLCFAGVAKKVYHTDANGIPLNAETDVKKFKVILFDTGLMLNILHFDFKPLLLNPDIGFINNGALAEQFAGQELLAYSNPRTEAGLFYWHREARSSNAEVDYVMEINNRVIPCEVKSGAIGSIKSLRIFMNEKKPPYGIRISGRNFSRDGDIVSVPFYGIEGVVKTGI